MSDERRNAADGDQRRTKVFLAEVTVLPKAGVNDPEGEAVLNGLRSLGYETAEEVVAGRFYLIRLSAADVETATRLASAISDRLLANPVLQSYSITVAPDHRLASNVDQPGVGLQ